MSIDRGAVIQAITEISARTAVDLAGVAIPASPIIGIGAGVGYNKAKGKYLKMRHKYAKHGTKGKWTEKRAANRRKLPIHAVRGMGATTLAASLSPVAIVGAHEFKRSKTYKRAAWKAGRHKRQAANVGKAGFDARGLKIIKRKPAKISGLLKATNEDRMEAKPKGIPKTRFKDLETGQKAAIVGAAAGAVYGGGREIRRAIKARKAQKAAKTPRAAKMHKKAFRKAVLRTLPSAALGGVTGSVAAAFPVAVRDVRREHSAAAGKYVSSLHPKGKQGYNPKHTTKDERGAAARRAVSKKAKKILDFDFRGHGRSLGKNEDKMTRTDLIESILEVFKGDIYSRQDKYGTETVIQKEKRRPFSKEHAGVADPKNLGAVTTIATSGRPTKKYASPLRADEVKFRAALKKLKAKK